MISVVRSFRVNVPGQPRLDSSEVRTGREMKARNAPRFVKRMQSCTVIEEHADSITRGFNLETMRNLHDAESSGRPAEQGTRR
jgi:hypothetical protein